MCDEGTYHQLSSGTAQSHGATETMGMECSHAGLERRGWCQALTGSRAGGFHGLSTTCVESVGAVRHFACRVHTDGNTVHYGVGGCVCGQPKAADRCVLLGDCRPRFLPAMLRCFSVGYGGLWGRRVDGGLSSLMGGSSWLVLALVVRVSSVRDVCIIRSLPAYWLGVFLRKMLKSHRYYAW